MTFWPSPAQSMPQTQNAPAPQQGGNTKLLQGGPPWGTAGHWDPLKLSHGFSCSLPTSPGSGHPPCLPAGPHLPKEEQAAAALGCGFTPMAPQSLGSGGLAAACSGRPPVWLSQGRQQQALLGPHCRVGGQKSLLRCAVSQGLLQGLSQQQLGERLCKAKSLHRAPSAAGTALVSCPGTQPPAARKPAQSSCELQPPPAAGRAQPPGSGAPAPAAAGTQEPALLQHEGLAAQRRLALQAGKVLLVPSRALHPQVVL